MKNAECRMACAVGILASSFCLEPAGNAAGTVVGRYYEFELCIIDYALYTSHAK